MFTLFNRLFSSISVKLFLSFWVITISSIVITRFISDQLEQQSIIIPLQESDLVKIKKITNKIAKKDHYSVEEIIKKVPRSRGTFLLLKHVDTNKVTYSQRRHIKPIAEYIEENSVSNLTSFQFPYARVTGPQAITIKQQNYQLYLIRKAKNTQFSTMFLQLPYWFRIIIPLFISALVCWLLARTLIKPIVEIKHAASEIGKGKYKTRLSQSLNRKDELGELSASFNQMAEKLEINISANKRLLADVSHELRSPLTRLQVALGLVEQATHGDNDITKHITRCEHELQELDGMIENVLSLSRMENSFEKAVFTSEKIDEIIQHAIETAQYVANEKDIQITCSKPTELTLSLDTKLMLSALNNILINAIKISNYSSEIKITTTKSESFLSIAIADEAIGVDEEKLHLLFTPFYRVSTARERTTGGTGLGLAIAKQAISAHDGNISAENNASGGLTITIDLPLKI